MLASFDYLWTSLRIQMEQLHVTHYLHNPLQCPDSALCWFFSLSISLLRKWRDLSCHLTSHSRVSLWCFLKLYLNFPIRGNLIWVIFWNIKIQHNLPFFLNRAYTAEVLHFPFLVANIQSNRKSVVIFWLAKCTSQSVKNRTSNY